jgi:hypothetical protein
LAVLATAAGAAMPAVAADDPPRQPAILDGPLWPNLRPEDLPDPTPNPQPAFVDPNPATGRILGGDVVGQPYLAGSDVTGSLARWPDLPPEPRPSPFAFEVGARYWYSTGSYQFAFSNGLPLFGNPTSTLDWLGLTAHSGEAFGRVDHKPTGLFAKGVLGLGAIADGIIDDRDFLVTQIKFSDTTSDVNDGKLGYALIDVGWAYWPTTDIRIGVFGGYHFWYERATAFGLRCNQTSLIGATCPFPGAIPIGLDVAVLRYEPTWHVVRLGVEGRAVFAERWSVNGEIAVVPFAALQNKDSHLLRQAITDLGPAPNVISDSHYAYGIEVEAFVNYAITPHIEIGGGVRYWGLAAHDGAVQFGPTFASNFQLNRFDQQRYGGLFHIKGRF